MEPALSLHRYLQANSASVIASMQAFGRQSESPQVASAALEISSNLQQLQPELAQYQHLLKGPDEPEGSGVPDGFLVYFLYNKFFFPLMRALGNFTDAGAMSTQVMALRALAALPASAWRGYLDYAALTGFGEYLRQKSVCRESVLRYKASFEEEGTILVKVFLDLHGAVNVFEVGGPLPVRGVMLAHDIENATSLLSDLVRQTSVILADDENWPSSARVNKARRERAKDDSSRILALLPKADLVRLTELLEANPDFLRTAAAELL